MNASIESTLDYTEQMLRSSLSSVAIVLNNPWVMDNASQTATKHTAVLLSRINRILIGLIDAHGIHEPIVSKGT